jgi:hypothetical protein
MDATKLARPDAITVSGAAKNDALGAEMIDLKEFRRWIFRRPVASHDATGKSYRTPSPLVKESSCYPGRLA